MKYVLGMVLLGVMYSIIFADINRVRLPEAEIGFFELNHHYGSDAKVKFDQIIFWDWVDHGRYNKEGKYIKTLERKCSGWYLLKNVREKLTPAEQRDKNQEVIAEWKANKNKGIAPDYVPKFLGSMQVPRYDVARKIWVVVLTNRNHLVKLKGHGFIETWTQDVDDSPTTDPEQANRIIFPQETRRKIIFQ